MKNSKEEFLKRLLKEDEEFRKAYTTHREYGRQIQKLDKKIFLTPPEKVERKKLQKLKLNEKDKMETVISRCEVMEERETYAQRQDKEGP
ncbi:MAG: DUF465 domain-containing protein [Thermodesulfobacteriota bacterium]